MHFATLNIGTVVLGFILIEVAEGSLQFRLRSPKAHYKHTKITHKHRHQPENDEKPYKLKKIFDQIGKFHKMSKKHATRAKKRHFLLPITKSFEPCCEGCCDNQMFMSTEPLGTPMHNLNDGVPNAQGEFHKHSDDASTSHVTHHATHTHVYHHSNDCASDPCEPNSSNELELHQHEYHHPQPHELQEGHVIKTEHGTVNGGFLQAHPTLINLHGEQHFHPAPIHITSHHHAEPTYESHDEQGSVSDHMCKNGGTYFKMSEQGFQCICEEGFIGKFCDEVNQCHPQPCLNGGTCHPIQADPLFMCQCKMGFYGPKCNEKDPCHPNPCKNSAMCTHDEGNVVCICPIKFTGPKCEKPKNCAPNPCQNGGTCTELEGPGRFRCDCEIPWKGTVCTETGFCHNNPCENGGTCRETGDNFVCDCVSGYSGLTCQENVCLPSPCMNGGTCMEDGDKFKCICSHWNAGSLCEENKPCLTKPCMNGGKCIDGSSGFQWSFAPLQYYCLCKPPYKGMQCEHHGCKHCDKNAHCVVDHCVCDEGYQGSGETCRKLANACHPNPCLNGGQCREANDDCEGISCGFTCVCPPPYLPPLCKEKNPCIPNPCKSGDCTALNVADQFSCKCIEGFKGKLCDEVEACRPSPCQHGGVCVSKLGKAECTCKGMWKPPLCKECGCPAIHGTGTPDMSCDLHGVCVCPTNWYADLNKGLCTKKVGPSVCATACCASPCDNDGICEDLPDGEFKCHCKTGTIGKVCQFKIICNPGPCENGGVCTEKDGQFLGCKCPSKFLPPYCKNPDIGGSTEVAVSSSQSVATSTTVSSMASSPGSHSGPATLCNPNPCQHGAVCMLNKGAYDCVCMQRFTGPHCEFDRCANCHQHARCVLGECKCNLGYIGNGIKCEQDICEQTCVEWATCINGNCVCNPGNPKVTHQCIHATGDEMYVSRQPVYGDDDDYVRPTFQTTLQVTQQTKPPTFPTRKTTLKATPPVNPSPTASVSLKIGGPPPAPDEESEIGPPGSLP